MFVPGMCWAQAGQGLRPAWRLNCFSHTRLDSRKFQDRKPAPCWKKMRQLATLPN